MQTQVVLAKKEFITAVSGLPGNRVIPENYEEMTYFVIKSLFRR